MPIEKWLTLLMLVAMIGIIIFIQIRSDILAIVALVGCVSYILFTWSSYGKTINSVDASECLIGQQKTSEGFILGQGCLDIWHVFHFLFWVIVGLLSPNHFVIALILSVLWEAVEHVAFKHGKIQQCDAKLCIRLEDIVLNMLGYMVGSVVANYQDQQKHKMQNKKKKGVSF